MKVPDLSQRTDSLRSYLESLVKDFLFDELSPQYLKSRGMEFLEGVPLPFEARDMVAFREGGLDVSKLADNMAVTIGANVRFPHVRAYVRFFAKYFDEKLIGVLCAKASENLAKREFRRSCAYSRAALLLDGESEQAMFSYACCCREWYLSMEDEDFEELIAILKKEASDYFEYTVMAHPDFAPAYYYLGFVYLNAGQYAKADIVWKRFLALCDPSKDEAAEIKEQLEKLAEPVKIEAGINKLLSGQIREGLEALEPYADSPYSNWWPLHYYLASAYMELGHAPEAIEGFRRVLQLEPSNLDSIKALADIYASLGDPVNEEKYRKKYAIVEENLKGQK